MVTRLIPTIGCNITYTDGYILDARLFHHLENWEPNSQVPGTTSYLTKMHTFHKHNSTAAYKIAGGVDPTTSSSTKPTKQKAIGPEYASKISKAFLDALYAFLDGLVHLASDDWHASDMSICGIETVGELGSNVAANVVRAPGLDLNSTVSPVAC
jgi:Exocyst complex component Sec5